MAAGESVGRLVLWKAPCAPCVSISHTAAVPKTSWSEVAMALLEKDSCQWTGMAEAEMLRIRWNWLVA